jgi:UPF0716 family protein affecting phage T7 exclusion
MLAMSRIGAAAEAVQQWLFAHPEVTIAAGAFSVLAFFGTLAVVPMIVIRLPADYFLYRRGTAGAFRRYGRGTRIAGRVLKNLAGAVVLAAGTAMLVLPGQGLLTILIALILLDFPGKRSLERRIIARPKVLRAVNGLRTKAGRPPLHLELQQEDRRV